MTKPYPMELRLRAVRFVETGESRHAVAERLGVSVSCVIKWLQRFASSLLEMFTSQECANYFANSGYGDV